MSFRVPTNLLASLRSDPDRKRGEWVEGLPDTVAQLAARWSLTVGEPYQPGGQCSWVAPVRSAAGTQMVLKVSWRHYEADDEAEGLRAWAGHGAVLVYDADIWGDTSALLLERCRPGTPLGLVLTEPEQDLIIAGLLQRLWSAPADGYTFRPLQTMCDTWAAEFEERLASSPGPLDAGLAHAGMELFRGLPASAEREVLLATDLHAGNVVASRRAPWLVIDPKPYVGDPAYDLLNCERLAADPAGLAHRMAGLLGLDGERVTQWLFARCVQESIDQPALGRIAAALAPG